MTLAPLIIDYFLYNGEPIIEYRLEYLYDYVDQFIIVECRYTHTGIKKPFLYVEKNTDFFKKYEKKLMIIIIDEFPDNNNVDSYMLINKNRPLLKDYSDDNWARETYNRNYAQNIILEKFKQPFILFVCDVDEIPNRNIINDLKYNYSELHDGIKLAMIMMRYNFKWKEPNTIWTHPFVITDIGTRNLSFNAVRLNQEGGKKIISNAGWHLSYFLTPNDIIRKFVSFAHSEYNNEKYKNKEYLLTCMLSGYFCCNKNEKCDYINENELPENWKPFQEKLDKLIFLEMY